MAEKRRFFVVTPFTVQKRARLNESQRQFESLKRISRQNLESGATRRMLSELEKIGVVSYRDPGYVIDSAKLDECMLSVEGKKNIGRHFDKRQEFALDYISRGLLTINPALVRTAMLESLKVINQMAKFGYDIRVQSFGDSQTVQFVRSALRAGSKEHKIDPSTFLSRATTTVPWARDQHTIINENIVYPKHPSVFGEGGTMVQVAPQEFLVSQGMKNDPVLKKYERQGITFHFFPDVPFFERALSELLGVDCYLLQNHIDYMVGAVPEKSVIAVDETYYNTNKTAFRKIKGKGFKFVFVPREEARRHPANFLPLGNGKALVDSGTPKFIKKLSDAGVEVIPTVIPIDTMLVLRGGLRCFINEDLV
ncbi:MAG TPA: hypothetical protein VFF13_05820 [archaeon]|nr:hypothetical protein [archaeon]